MNRGHVAAPAKYVYCCKYTWPSCDLQCKQMVSADRRRDRHPAALKATQNRTKPLPSYSSSGQQPPSGPQILCALLHDYGRMFVQCVIIAAEKEKRGCRVHQGRGGRLDADCGRLARLVARRRSPLDSGARMRRNGYTTVHQEWPKLLLFV